MTGQEAYETDVKRKPLYHDGTSRRTWDQLDPVTKWSWKRNPTPRGYEHKQALFGRHFRLACQDKPFVVVKDYLAAGSIPSVIGVSLDGKHTTSARVQDIRLD